MKDQLLTIDGTKYLIKQHNGRYCEVEYSDNDITVSMRPAVSHFIYNLYGEQYSNNRKNNRRLPFVYTVIMKNKNQALIKKDIDEFTLYCESLFVPIFKRAANIVDYPMLLEFGLLYLFKVCTNLENREFLKQHGINVKLDDEMIRDLSRPVWGNKKRDSSADKTMNDDFIPKYSILDQIPQTINSEIFFDPDYKCGTQLTNMPVYYKAAGILYYPIVYNPRMREFTKTACQKFGIPMGPPMKFPPPYGVDNGS